MPAVGHVGHAHQVACSTAVGHVGHAPTCARVGHVGHDHANPDQPSKLRAAGVGNCVGSGVGSGVGHVLQC